ncbi:hypothetical protein Vafri_6216 [Volvox africanus]|uniref:Uncharacterized protein n=1 Tax=Volvox africanus TaxID=51714 RepID=A0A8J4EXU5_9CHLO|nr:hypothetical protein Vafri_6216 [Volvox africanus]
MPSFCAPCTARTQTGAVACSIKSMALPRYARLQPCYSSKPDVAEPLTSTSVSAVASTTLGTTGRAIATFRASKLGRQPIVESQRPLGDIPPHFMSWSPPCYNLTAAHALTISVEISPFLLCSQPPFVSAPRVSASIFVS